MTLTHSSNDVTGAGIQKKTGPVLSPDSIASWHNQACDYVYDNYTFTDSITGDQLIEDVINLVGDFLVAEKGIVQADVDSIKADLISLAIDNKSIMSYHYKMSSSTFNTAMSSYAPTLGVTTRFKDSLVKAYEKGGDDSATIMNYITFTFADNVWTGNDQTNARILRKVSVSSNNYWSERMGGGYQTDWDCTSWVIFNDGLGSILGLPFGGIGAAILGTTFSIGTNEDCIKKSRSSGTSYF